MTPNNLKMEVKIVPEMSCILNISWTVDNIQHNCRIMNTFYQIPSENQNKLDPAEYHMTKYSNQKG
jgi:hypothetical protein